MHTPHTKIVICGPPHSGKSVFIANLEEYLPMDTMVIRACPDGEGKWSNNQDQRETAAVRRKGTFSRAFVNRSCSRIDVQDHSHITLIDVGGKITDENEQIFRHCDAFVVLSSDPVAKDAWRQFGEQAGLKCIGLIDSSLEGRQEIIASEPGQIFKARITGLERGTYQQSAVLKNMAARILEELPENEYIRSTSNAIRLENDTLGEACGVTMALALNDHTTVRKTVWTPESLRTLKAELNKIHGQAVEINGVKANFVIAMAVRQLTAQNCDVRLYNAGTSSYISIPHAGSKKGESVLDVQMESAGRNAMLHIVPKESFKGNFIDPEDIECLSIPSNVKNKDVYLSARLPHWGLCSLVNALDCRNIYTFQPGRGYTCVSGDDLGQFRSSEEVRRDFQNERDMTISSMNFRCNAPEMAL